MRRPPSSCLFSAATSGTQWLQVGASDIKKAESNRMNVPGRGFLPSENCPKTETIEWLMRCGMGEYGRQVTDFSCTAFQPGHSRISADRRLQGAYASSADRGREVESAAGLIWEVRRGAQNFATATRERYTQRQTEHRAHADRPRAVAEHFIARPSLP